MRNGFLVALREYLENAKTKGFWLGIFMMPLVISLSIQVPIYLEKRGTPSRHVVIVDQSGEFGKVIDSALDNQQQRQERIRREYHRVECPVEGGGNLETIAQNLRPYLRGEKTVSFQGRDVKIDSAILIPRDITNHVLRANDQPRDARAGVQFWSANLTDKSLRNIVENAINHEVRQREFLARGLDIALFKEIEKTRLPIVELNPKKEQGKERVTTAEAITQWAPVGFVYLLWVSIFSVSQMLLSNTIEEKSNRVIEVLLSSVTPAEFVLGKLAGIAAVGMTMIAAWLGSLFVIVSWTTGGQSEVGIQFLDMLKRSALLPSFVIYFFFGYLLYAGVILAIGSVCNTMKEAQNYMAVITLLMTVPLLTMMFIVKDPNGPVARTLSWVPFYTPFVMMNRAAAGPPWYELIGTMLVLIGATIGVLWAAVKIFHVGILRTGQPPRLVELFRMLRG